MNESKKFAVIRSGGKQYTVKEGQRLLVGKLEGQAGEEVKFDEVLLVGSDNASSNVGLPLVSGAKVVAKIVGHEKGAKVIIFRKRRRKGFTKKQGHRQDYTRVEVTSIQA